ncbi:signal peptide, CUB and EGF-like domain-containing protein 1 [Penaeus monodon]|uniref:signal peptide, CUB and EGF-like domain-containing protein 1 n=1 Tax=Penaeus monodon TaxID=6687 RepID=UPI0018A785E2|nr:signal peptide, CUB and EGF-like domain-containing protein 1 [Penaeus monodon]
MKEITKKALTTVTFLRRIKHLEIRGLKDLYNGQVYPFLEYVSLPWTLTSNTYLDQLEKVQQKKSLSPRFPSRDGCGRSAVLEVQTAGAGGSILEVNLEYSSPRLWTLHLADSPSATGYKGGNYTEAHIKNRQWRVYGKGEGILQGALDGQNLLAVTDNIARNYHPVRLYVSHNLLEWRYRRKFRGRRGRVQSKAAFSLGARNPDSSENSVGRLYLGLNRVIGWPGEAGVGLCHVTVTLLNDACKTGRHKCDRNAVCKSFKRLHRCSCKKGWEGNGRACADVDECRLRNGGCVHVCANSPGNYSCSCHGGFAPDPLDPHNCQDIDECADRNGGCQHSCRNTIGSFACGCREGFTLATDGRACVASPACWNLRCQQHCLVSAAGTPSCGCREGYVLVRARQCEPTCAVGNGGCQHHCHQSTNGPACTCHSKYLLAADGQSCVPSCAINNGGCERRCHNTATGVRCSCTKGFLLHADHRSCLDVDECATDNGGCEYLCINNYGSYECVCPTGYKLQPDERTCRDVDECAVKGTCEHMCTNSPGSYQCSCKEGYQLFATAHCGDVNECSVDNGGCSQECINIEGSYKCACEAGYRLHPNGKDCLQTDKCTPLRNPNKAEVSCYHLEDYGYEERCTVRCRAGARFTSGPDDYYVFTCGRHTAFTWTTQEPAANASHLACSESQVEPGFKWSVRLMLTTSVANNTTIPSVAKPLMDALADKISYCMDKCHLRFISEQVTKAKRMKIPPNTQVIRAAFDVLVFPPPPQRRCRHSCARRQARRFVPGVLGALRKTLLSLREVISDTGQKYEIIPKTFKTRRHHQEACPDGYVLIGNKCVACSQGSYHDPRNNLCLACPAGEYQEREGQTSCQACPPSAPPGGPHKLAARNASECSDACPAGHWSIDGFSPCRPCPAGTFQSDIGRVECIPCPEGLTSPGAASSLSQCLQGDQVCQPGHFWSRTSRQCESCPRGYYQPDEGASSCRQCPGGVDTDHTASVTVDDCKRQECGGFVGNLSGVFETPNYPGNYPNNARCTWIVKPAKGRKVLVVVPEIRLSHDQCGDYLVLRKSKSPYSTVSYETCSSVDRPMVFNSRSRRLWVHFRSDGNGTQQGFRIRFVTYNEEYHKLIETIVKDNRLYSLHNHLEILRDRELLPRLLEVVAEPIKYYEYAKKKEKLFPSSFIRLLTPKVRRFFSYKRR